MLKRTPFEINEKGTQLIRSETSGDRSKRTKHSVVGVFAGIGGIEQGFRREGHESILLCEADVRARQVLGRRFANVRVSEDVRDLKSLPECGIVAAGFPCQDLSQAGRTRGIQGPNSGLIDVLLKLLKNSRPGPRWLVLENVPFMLSLDRGRAIERIVSKLEGMGFAWAYRTVDARAFGLPQRRRRVVILASRQADPRAALLGDDAGVPEPSARGAHACGFYWTEGNTGLGWAINAIPPLKGGSGVHIPSPPAIWFPRRRFVAVPTIEAAERLQGFEAGWTGLEGEEPKYARERWRLVGNAVSVPFAQWIAGRLDVAEIYDEGNDDGLRTTRGWPSAGWGFEGRRGCSAVSEWPVSKPAEHLARFLGSGIVPLSRKAASGFLSRLERSNLRSEEAFRRDLRHHISQQ
ncbi:DNA cytosine methyltransferase [Bradyrhizobium zhanjiangense]|uniref:DNA cytosine methyltransferase n=1 Tax=Bradyrhizobium zhanjiangense TaxID=1325107 RepID=UPI001ABF5FE1|nr:DNA (cytosine-5-)-methyltransferase [Bradyrhizobium zhanjiangense]